MRDGCKLLLFRDFGIIKAADDNVPRILAVGLQVLSQRMGMRANLELKGTLEDIVKEVVYVGDALKPGNALNAIEEGYMAALDI